MGKTAIQIRLATLDDLSALANFARFTFAEAYRDDMGESAVGQHVEEKLSNQQFAEMLQHDTFYLAQENSELLGFVQVGAANPAYKPYVDTFDTGAYEVRRLYVLADQQGKGIGSRLLTTGMHSATSSGGQTVYLTTWQANTGAQRLYRSFGFQKVGEIPEYGRNGELNGYEFIMACPVASGPK